MEGETCLIITGGNLNLDFAEQFLKHRSYGCVIAVDGGLEAAAALGVCPDEIVGDLDTVNPALFDSYRRKPGIELEIHRPEKDETDTELALLTAERKGFHAVHLLGALGGRMDHALGNVQLLNQCLQNDVHAEIYDEKNRISSRPRQNRVCQGTGIWAIYFFSSADRVGGGDYPDRL